jgi:hypothetical protein
MTPVVFDRGEVRKLPLPGRLGRAAVAWGNIIVGESLRTEGAWNDIAVWQDEELLGIIDDLPGISRTVFDINRHGRYVGVYADIGLYGGFAGIGLDAHELIYPGFSHPRALSINDADQIAGVYLPDGFTRTGYVAHGTDVTRLFPLPGEVESPVWGINNAGDMVGLSTTSVNGPETATVYYGGATTPIDMNTLVDLPPDVKLVRGIDINNHGQILVEGETPLGYRYYVLTPVPEPAALAIVLLAAIVCRRQAGRKCRERS